MRRYELMLLFRPDLEDDKLQAAVEKVTRAIVNAGGALTKVSPWGKRRLAYEIQHFRDASYFLIHFDIAPSAVREIERGLLISEEILRHLVIVLEDRGPASEEVEAVPARRLRAKRRPTNPAPRMRLRSRRPKQRHPPRTSHPPRKHRRPKHQQRTHPPRTRQRSRRPMNRAKRLRPEGRRAER